MTRAAIYARYSSNNQRDASIEDQVRICRARIEREGWTSVEIYSDAALSGATALRPGYQKLLEDARNGVFDVVIAEALDRLSRDQEDVAGLFKQLSFSGVTLLTIAEGEISELHVGFKGTMNALYLKDLAQKTHRGLEGRVREGRSGGGLCYGYDIVKEFDSSGEPVRGKRRINETEAEVVRLIFRQYGSGKSTRSIAEELNKNKIPGPSGRPWSDYSIHGNRRRATGVLNNELYIGRLIWNRQHFVKDPATGKRQARLNPKDEWVTADVPDLRIVDDDLWSSVKVRQKGLSFEEGNVAKGAELNRRHRNRYLLSGLIKCGTCGGNYIIVGKDAYGCATRRTKRTCENDHVMRRQDIEALVLAGLKDKMLEPELVREFIREFNTEITRNDSQRINEFRRTQANLKDVERKLTAIVDAIEQGIVTETTRTRLVELEVRRKELTTLLAHPEPQRYPALHPNLAELYRKKVEKLEDAIGAADIRIEAREILRTLIDRIEVTPQRDDDDAQVRIVLYGELASIFALAEEDENVENNTRFSLVAGARNQRYLHIAEGWLPRAP